MSTSSVPDQKHNRHNTFPRSTLQAFGWNEVQGLAEVFAAEELF